MVLRQDDVVSHMVLRDRFAAAALHGTCCRFRDLVNQVLRDDARHPVINGWGVVRTRHVFETAARVPRNHSSVSEAVQAGHRTVLVDGPCTEADDMTVQEGVTVNVIGGLTWPGLGGAWTLPSSVKVFGDLTVDGVPIHARHGPTAGPFHARRGGTVHIRNSDVRVTSDAQQDDGAWAEGCVLS